MTRLGDFITTNVAECNPMTRESFEAGIAAMRDPQHPMNRAKPVQHIMHPRFERGEWTRCSCGRLHRKVDGEVETA